MTLLSLPQWPVLVQSCRIDHMDHQAMTENDEQMMTNVCIKSFKKDSSSPWECTIEFNPPANIREIKFTNYYVEKLSVTCTCESKPDIELLSQQILMPDCNSYAGGQESYSIPLTKKMSQHINSIKFVGDQSCPNWKDFELRDFEIYAVQKQQLHDPNLFMEDVSRKAEKIPKYTKNLAGSISQRIHKMATFRNEINHSLEILSQPNHNL